MKPTNITIEPSTCNSGALVGYFQTLVRMRFGRLIIGYLRAVRTLDPKDWSNFADNWLTICSAFPERDQVWLIAGSVLKSAERYSEACDAFRRAIDLAPARASGFLGLGRALKARGERPAAIEAFEMAISKGDRKAAAAELIRYGARDRVAEKRDDIFPVRDYAGFVANNPVGPPPCNLSISRPFLVYIDGRSAEWNKLSATLESLFVQTCSDWLGYVIFDPAHPNDEARAAHGEPRLCWIPAHELHQRQEGSWAIPLRAGVIMDRYALAWLSWTVSSTMCSTAYADHDRYDVAPDGTRHRLQPALHPMFDKFWFAYALHAPALAAHRISEKEAIYGDDLFSKPFGNTQLPAAHVPRILASIPFDPSGKGSVRSPRSILNKKISVIIPTRDNPALLRECIRTLSTKAERPERLEIIILDNQSILPEAKALFQDLSSAANVSIHLFDETFNWSRANNFGAAKSTGEQLIFLNDDTEMFTDHWDSIVAGLLEAEPDAGLVGVRMLYPDNSIQHAGFVFGMDNGPQHEGRWMPSEEAGPEDRWNSARQAVAVTGAFMAMRRDVFDAVGGFDEVNYAVDFGDVDMCLRVRSSGWSVIYLPEITILHHESVSRGYNKSRKKRKRSRDEARKLGLAWGSAVVADPGYNPQWTRKGYAFDGYRKILNQEIAEHVQCSATTSSWTISSLAEKGLRELQSTLRGASPI